MSKPVFTPSCKPHLVDTYKTITSYFTPSQLAHIEAQVEKYYYKHFGVTPVTCSAIELADKLFNRDGILVYPAIFRLFDNYSYHPNNYRFYMYGLIGNNDLLKIYSAWNVEFLKKKTVTVKICTPTDKPEFCVLI